jgi:glycosyltransferase family protein
MNIHTNKTLRYPRKAFKHLLAQYYNIIIRIYKMPTVLSIEDTLLEIINNKKSISRFGDGEFTYFLDKANLPFQEYDEELAKKLEGILVSDNSQLLVGLPVGLQSLENLHSKSKTVWKAHVAWTYPRLKKYLNLSKTYYNASMTRVYAPYEDKSKSTYYFELLMRIWESREVVLIEGEKSRLGVGNDLFGKTNSLKRVLAPKHHAFRKFEDLLYQIKKQPKDTLILLALGPTATALSYDSTLLGYQTVDIGNVDLEYEWYLRKAQKKIKIPGKYTSEAKDGRIVEDVNDELYFNQIIADYSFDDVSEK